MFRTYLSIAGLCFQLRVRGPFDVARFRHRFGPYESPEPGPLDGELLLHVEPQGQLLVPADVPYPGVKTYGTSEGYKMLREGLSLWVGADGRSEGFVRGPEKIPAPSHEEDGGPAETPLRLITSLLLLRSGRGALFHACGHADERGAILFLGQSGAGKTTLARQLPPSSVLSDDQVALLGGPSVTLCSTPFVGVLGRTIPPRHAPLRALLLLDSDRRGEIHQLSTRQRSAALLACLPLYARDAVLASSALALIDRLRAVPAFRGSFSLTEGAMPWIERIFQLASSITERSGCARS
ncbi:MAG: hypothetical protein RMJ98_11945 [Myxococcales bacterium]|nr:hypothetical protein [Polyangiaceae bacterium]MDW8249998.1 hypothetical protein [Myxococcales bacterium]